MHKDYSPPYPIAGTGFESVQISCMNVLPRSDMSMIYCGTSNIVLPVPNKTFFPEEYREKSRLQYYASLFNSLEINRSFYKVPRSATIARWAGEVPQDFRFSVKLWKGITHVKSLAFDKRDLVSFLRTMAPFAAKKGCLLVQLPAGTRANHLEQLVGLMNLISEHNDGWKIAVEFRHVSWYTDKVWRLLEKHRACVVEHDMPASITPDPVPEAAFRFIRFHGAAGDYKGTYDDVVLDRYAGSIHRDITAGKEVYVYFNNTIGDAVYNALTLQKLLKAF
jgi:uncharacterized protein YecE (DUF72 family)